MLPTFALFDAGHALNLGITRRISHAFVKFVELISLGISIARPGHVVTNVEHFSSPESVKVYNLTLAEDNAYYANGLLVQNCADAAFVLLDLCRERFGFRSGERAANPAPQTGPLANSPAAYQPPPSPWTRFVEQVSLDIPTLI